MPSEAAATLPAPDLIWHLVLHIGEGGTQPVDVEVPCLGIEEFQNCLANALLGMLQAGVNIIIGILTFIPDLIIYTPHPEPGLAEWYTGSGLDQPWQSLYDRTYSQSVMLATVLLMFQLFFIFFFASVSPFLGSYQKERLFRRWILALIGVWGWVQLAGTALAFAHFFPHTIKNLGSGADPALSTESLSAGDVITTLMIVVIAWVIAPTILLGAVAMYALRNLLLIVYLYGMPLLIALWPIDVGFMKPISSKSKTWMQKFVPLLIMTIPNAFLLKTADIIENTPGSLTDILIGLNVEGTVSSALFEIIDLLVVMLIPLVAIILPKFIFGMAGQAFSMGKQLSASGTMASAGADEEAGAGAGGGGDGTPAASPGGEAAAGGGEGASGGGSDSAPRLTDPDSKLGKAADAANSAREKASYIAPNEVKMGRHTIASQNSDRFQRRAYNQTKRGVASLIGKNGQDSDDEGRGDTPDTVDEAEQRAAEAKQPMNSEKREELVRDAKATHQDDMEHDDTEDITADDIHHTADPEGRKNLSRRKLGLNPKKDDISDDEIEDAYNKEMRTADGEQEEEALKAARNTLRGDEDIPTEFPEQDAATSNEETLERAKDVNAYDTDDVGEAADNYEEESAADVAPDETVYQDSDSVGDVMDEDSGESAADVAPDETVYQDSDSVGDAMSDEEAETEEAEEVDASEVEMFDEEETDEETDTE